MDNNDPGGNDDLTEYCIRCDAERRYEEQETMCTPNLEHLYADNAGERALELERKVSKLMQENAMLRSKLLWQGDLHGQR